MEKSDKKRRGADQQPRRKRGSEERVSLAPIGHSRADTSYRITAREAWYTTPEQRQDILERYAAWCKNQDGLIYWEPLYKNNEENTEKALCVTIYGANAKRLFNQASRLKVCISLYTTRESLLQMLQETHV